MPTIDLLSGLHFYFFLLSSLAEQELKGTHDAQILKTVSLQFNTISLKLEIKSTGNNPLLYFQASFKINQQKVICEQIYSQNRDREKEIKSFILAQTPKEGYGWDTTLKADRYTHEVMRYLNIADEIAKKGYLCSSGDDYKTGYFSKISVIDNEIVLEQTNYYNSRSTDHKDDYYMRDLKFHIPLEHFKEKSINIGDDNHEIGAMRVFFSDRSSDKNKSCGNAIKDKIKEESEKSEQDH